jgi:hypothetical protein
MLSKDDRLTLMQIERQLQEDRAFRRVFGRLRKRPVRWTRRCSLALLLTSLVLMVGIAALGSVIATVESAGLATVGVAAVWFSSRCGDRPAAPGRLSDHRP